MTLLYLSVGAATSACASSGASMQGKLRSGQWQVHLPSTHNPVEDVVQSSSHAAPRSSSLADLDAVVTESSAKSGGGASAK
jgi:hypothetical protein